MERHSGLLFVLFCVLLLLFSFLLLFILSLQAPESWRVGCMRDNARLKVGVGAHTTSAHIGQISPAAFLWYFYIYFKIYSITFFLRR